jgi:hypothetical protein
MAHWNWINGVYNYEQACKRIDELNEEVSKLSVRLRKADKIILDLMEQHIKRDLDFEWKTTYLSSDEGAVRYEKQYQLSARENIGDLIE